MKQDFRFIETKSNKVVPINKTVTRVSYKKLKRNYIRSIVK